MFVSILFCKLLSSNVGKIAVYNYFSCLLIACCPKFSALLNDLSDIQLLLHCCYDNYNTLPCPPCYYYSYYYIALFPKHSS